MLTNAIQQAEVCLEKGREFWIDGELNTYIGSHSDSIQEENLLPSIAKKFPFRHTSQKNVRRMCAGGKEVKE
ncbi:hypothetical protein TNCV_754701 [Trichonephila clavipes]|nr:hypothetical protein TNCV_754701 [Trichonephila clavipes]